MVKKKEEHTTFEVGPISESRMRAIIEDVWRVGAGRVALGEEVGGSVLAPGEIQPVLLPQEHPGTGFEKGVGTPYVVQHPDNPSKYTLLFTGWATNNGQDRRLFAADITKNLELSNFRQLAQAGDFPNAKTTPYFDGVTTVHALWDSYNKNWVTTHGVRSAVAGEQFRIGVARFNEGFTALIEAASYHPAGFTRISDTGAPLIPSGEMTSSQAVMTVGDFNEKTLKLVEVDDYRLLPHGTAALTTRQEIVKWGGSAISQHFWPDVHQTFIRNNTLVIIAEILGANRTPWCLSVGVAPVLGLALANYRDIQVPMSSSPFLENNFTTGHPHTGHPHYSSLFGRPVLFFAWFRGLHQGSVYWAGSPGPNQLRHEIWVQGLRGDEFKLENLAPLSALGPVDANESSPWMPTYGRDTTIFWNAGEAGTIRVDKAINIVEGRDAGVYQTTTQAIPGAQVDYLTFSRPPPWIRIRTSAFATPTIKTWVLIH